jgi:hypothetical protein
MARAGCRPRHSVLTHFLFTQDWNVTVTQIQVLTCLQMEALKMGLDGIERVVKKARGDISHYGGDGVHDEPAPKTPNSPIQFWKGKGDGWHSKIHTATGEGVGGKGPHNEGEQQ